MDYLPIFVDVLQVCYYTINTIKFYEIATTSTTTSSDSQLPIWRTYQIGFDIWNAEQKSKFAV